MRRSSGLALVVLAALAVPACGGDDEGDGVPTPDEVLACLTEEHGLQAEKASSVGAASAGIYVVTPDSVSQGDYLTISFYKNAEDARQDAPSEFVPGYNPITDTVGISYNPDYFGVEGPKATEDIRDCVGS